MRVNVRRKRRVCVVELAGRLTLEDGASVPRQQVAELLEAGERRFVFDLNGLSVIDSAGVGEIVACYKRAAENAAVVKIALRPDGLVRRVFEISGLERALEVFDEVDDAIASYS